MLPRISPPPPFLSTPGTPAIPWSCWQRLFENFALASGASELSAARRRTLLLHCLGPERQRIFDALPSSYAPDLQPEQPRTGTASPCARCYRSHRNAGRQGSRRRQNATGRIRRCP
ncbi:hypothetical protein HPB49_013800 [Dermacentor silvarum]|uniref:Uncharacterized protein n=1 Tax=Dermacentor silvarum TaxID=543639 RepID=A0ACB8E0T2_DERSI|nr:hypothetical protein HPB49_013800 [Dermacentor silvarum]